MEEGEQEGIIHVASGFFLTNIPVRGKMQPAPGRCRSTQHAPGDVNPKRSKLTRPRLWRRPYHTLIPPTALPLPVPMHKSPLPAGAGVTSSAPRIRGLENNTRERRRDFPGPFSRTSEPRPRVRAYLQIKGLPLSLLVLAFIDI